MSWPAAAVHRVIRAYEVRGLVGDESDEPLATDLGAAFARLMRSDTSQAAKQVVIGHDMRDSSPSLAAAFAAGVTGQGFDVVRIGLASTDQLYFASGVLDCPGAMFTASHNPAAYNGIKLCRAGAKPVGADTGLTTITDDVIAGVASHEGPTGIVTDKDVLAEYGDFLRSLVDTSGLRPLRVAVDAGNGMAGHTTPAVLGAIDSILFLPGLLGSGLRDAGRAVCACRTRQTGAPAVRGHRRLPALRVLRRDQLHRGRCRLLRRSGAQVVRHSDPLHRPPRRGDRRPRR